MPSVAPPSEGLSFHRSSGSPLTQQQKPRSMSRTSLAGAFCRYNVQSELTQLIVKGKVKF